MGSHSDGTTEIHRMRQIDAKAVSFGLPVFLMMENAGNALARYMLKGLDNDLRGKKIAVVCGLSNNGGGGLASGRHLAYYGASVNVIILGKPEDLRTNDAKLQWKTLEKFDSIKKFPLDAKEEDLEKLNRIITEADGIIDAIFGTGFSGVIRTPQSNAIDYINSSKAYVVSNDVPSGIDPDTGRISEKAVSSDITVVLHRLKPGIKGPHVVESIGIPPDAEK